MIYRKNYLLALVLGLSLLGTAYPLQAQEGTKVIHQPVYWFAADIAYHWGPGYALSLQAQERRFLNPGQTPSFKRLERVLPNLRLTKEWGNHWKLGLGQWFFTIAQPADPDLPVNALIPEHRTYMSLTKGWPMGQGERLELRGQSEFRLFRGAGENHFSGAVQRSDYRQRFQVTYSWPLGDQYRLKAGEELHLTMASSAEQSFFDQNRLIMQISRHWGKEGRLKTSAGFIHWWQATGADRTFFARYILRAQLGYRFGTMD